MKSRGKRLTMRVCSRSHCGVPSAVGTVVTLTLGVTGALGHSIESGDKYCDSSLVYEVLVSVFHSLSWQTLTEWLEQGRSKVLLSWIYGSRERHSNKGLLSIVPGGDKGFEVQSMIPRHWISQQSSSVQQRKRKQGLVANACNPSLQETNTVSMASSRSAWSIQWVLSQVLGNTCWERRRP